MASDGRPLFGRRLMPSVLDELAKNNPNKLFAAIPKSSDVEQGFRDITVADAARCINFMARWILDKFGRSETFETISYIGIADLRGALLFQSAVKCGYKFLLLSPRNPPATSVSLMNQTGSTKLLFAEEVRPLVKPIPALEPGIRLEVIPSFEEMMRSTPEHYPYEKTYDEAKNEPAVVLHSSGSTGLPKPIIMTHGSFSVLDNEHNLPEVPGRTKRDWTMWSFKGEGRVYTAFPFFHLGGFLMHTGEQLKDDIFTKRLLKSPVASIFGNTSLVLGPPNMIPDGALLKSVMTHQKLRALLLPPAIIDQVLHEPNGIDYFKTLDFVTYGGAPMKKASGEQLLKYVPIGTPYGSTESYPLPELIPTDPEDWDWHEWNPVFKHELELYDADEGTYELVLIADESTKDTTAVYHNLPGIGRFYTKDLWTRHPEKPHLYKFYGRRDDIIVLSNGEKFNPVPFETHVQAHPSLKGALVTGNRRTQAALLIEPKEPLNEENAAKLIEELIPVIEESNTLLPGQGRIHRGKILCALPDKPFRRTGKGTVIRKLTEDVYVDEIEKLYSSTSGGNVEVDLKPTLKPSYESATVDDFLRRIMSASFPAAATIDGDEDFFAYGLDSVQTLEIVSNLKRNIQAQASKSASWISPRTIFHNPTINDLSRLIRAFLNDGTVPMANSSNDRVRTVDGIVASYLESLPEKSAMQSEGPRTPSVVAVIGSTGYMGSYLLANLLKTPTISRIYCLNRSKKSQAQEKQEKALQEIDGSLTSVFDKLTYFTVELGKPKLGMAPEEYEKVSSEVDVIVYNAWRLDFGLSIRSFEPFLRATRDIVDLASSNNIHIVFVSSLSSAGKMATKTRVPEAPINDALAPFSIGYGQSKHVAERILTAANSTSGIPVSVVRVCQIGGPTGPGKWADQPWISGLARTAKAVGSIPSNVAVVDWVAVDTAAEMLRDFIVFPAPKEAQFYHISHPKPLVWDSIVDVLGGLLSVTKAVPLREWVERLSSQDSKAAAASTMPALTMQDFFEELGDGAEKSSYDTTHALATFKGEMHVLDKSILEGWLKSWDL